MFSRDVSLFLLSKAPFVPIELLQVFLVKFKAADIKVLLHTLCEVGRCMNVRWWREYRKVLNMLLCTRRQQEAHVLSAMSHLQCFGLFIWDVSLSWEQNSPLFYMVTRTHTYMYVQYPRIPFRMAHSPFFVLLAMTMILCWTHQRTSTLSDVVVSSYVRWASVQSKITSKEMNRKSYRKRRKKRSCERQGSTETRRYSTTGERYCNHLATVALVS